jgi:hypothetical protein
VYDDDYDEMMKILMLMIDENEVMYDDWIVLFVGMNVEMMNQKIDVNDYYDEFDDLNVIENDFVNESELIISKKRSNQ